MLACSRLQMNWNKLCKNFLCFWNFFPYCFVWRYHPPIDQMWETVLQKMAACYSNLPKWNTVHSTCFWHTVLSCLHCLCCWYGRERRNRAQSAIVPIGVRGRLVETVPFHVGLGHVLYSLSKDSTKYTDNHPLRFPRLLLTTAKQN